MEDLVDSSTDWSFLDSDDSDLDELLHDDDTEMMLLVLGMKEIEDRAKLLDRRTGLTMRVITTSSCITNDLLHSFPTLVCVR
jgi:hypothetical protein